jgi:hypothetical protein
VPLPPIDPDIGERQTLDEIRDWYRGMVEALVDQRAAVLQAVQNGTPVAPRFIGLNQAGLEAYFDAQRQELDRLTMLNLVASAEASIKDDYFHRVRRQLKDQLSRAYQQWYDDLAAGKKHRPDFDEGGILEVLKGAHVMNNHIVGEYRECLRPRHWVGHGRNWNTPVGIDRLDPDDVYDRCNALLAAIP